MLRRTFLSAIVSTVIATNAGAQYPVGSETPRPLYSGARDLLAKLVLISRSQVELGGIGLQKAQRPDVTAFARLMLTDYTRADTELTVMAEAMNVDTKLVEPRLRGLERRLDALSGQEFEREYTQAMFEMNQDVVSLLRLWAIDASKRQADDPLTRWASAMLPKAEQYLERARQLQQTVK